MVHLGELGEVQPEPHHDLYDQIRALGARNRELEALIAQRGAELAELRTVHAGTNSALASTFAELATVRAELVDLNRADPNAGKHSTCYLLGRLSVELAHLRGQHVTGG